MEKKSVDVEDVGIENSNEQVFVNKEPNISLDGIDKYRDAIRKYKLEIIALVKDGTMHEQTGAKLIMDAEYSFYQQMIQLRYE